MLKLGTSLVLVQAKVDSILQIRERPNGFQTICTSLVATKICLDFFQFIYSMFMYVYQIMYTYFIVSAQGSCDCYV